MSILRQDPTTKEWVIIASERAKRPDEFAKPEKAGGAGPLESTCPFCPGNEAKTPQEVLRKPARDGKGWAVRVVPNRYAALSREGSPNRRQSGPLFREMDGAGAHEVVIETPIHNRSIPLMSEEEVKEVLIAYQERYRALREDPRIRYVLIFKNHGEGAGTSLAHPHSQIAATPVAPMQVRRKYEVAVGHYDDTGRCLYCDLVEEERLAKVRMVEESERFVAFHPYASHLPFETWIAPKAHQPSFGAVSRPALDELAGVLKKVLASLYSGLGDPDYNYILHTAPVEDETKPYFLWHLQILPRLAMIAGFELGSGISITPVSPETSAEFIRAVSRGGEEGSVRGGESRTSLKCLKTTGFGDASR